jgi:CHAT domain-containing protein
MAAKQAYVLMTQSKDQMARGQADVAAARLSQMVLGPVADQLGAKRLLIVADGALQYVPFAALPKPVNSGQWTVDSRKTRTNCSLSTDHCPLIVDHEVVSVPSASVLGVLRKELAGRSSAPKSVAVLADPVFQQDDPRLKARDSRRKTPNLPQPASDQQPATSDRLERSARDAGLANFERLRFTRREAEAIASLAPATARLKAIDFQANRAIVMGGDLSQYRIIHFATHGLLNSVHPELSGLVLSLVDEQGQSQDGFVRLHEIYNLKLGADLVVLSACQTALGKEVKGEGLVGLTRGFMYAGAPRVLVSLWNVSDEATAELMKRFYGNVLKEGLRPAAALRAAQVGLRKERRWQAPYFWAGFVLQGEWK